MMKNLKNKKETCKKKLGKDIYNMYNGHKNILWNSVSERIKIHVNMDETTEGNIEQNKQFLKYTSCKNVHYLTFI